MKILFIHSTTDLYGASRSLLRMASRLVLDGHFVYAVLPQEGVLATELRGAGVEVTVQRGLACISRQQLNGWKRIIYFPIGTVLSCVRTAKLAWEIRPDIIHSNTALILPGGIAGKVLGIPHIFHVREIFSEVTHLWSIYQWFLYFFSDCIVCNSCATAAQFGPLFKSKMQVVHNGYPADEFLPVPWYRVQRFRHRYGLDGHQIVGLVGRIRFGRKGQDIFLKAAAALAPRFPNVKFLCIGSPFPGNEEHLQRLHLLVSQLGLDEVAIYTGDVEDIKAAYAALDVSVQASVLPESFGGVVVESMAMGTPVIATAIGAGPELIENEVSGLLVEPSDPDRLAKAIERLLLDVPLRQQFGKAGKERYLQKFEFEVFYSKIANLYASMQ